MSSGKWEGPGGRNQFSTGHLESRSRLERETGCHLERSQDSRQEKMNDSDIHNQSRSFKAWSKDEPRGNNDPNLPWEKPNSAQGKPP